MLNYIWSSIIIISIAFSFINGNFQGLSDAIFSGLESAVSLILTMIGIICFWSGLIKIAERSGLTNVFAKFISPLTQVLFPKLSKDSKAVKAISMNMSANMLGLGSAATPLGLNAMKELKKLNPLTNTATDEMVMFVLINTASIQILPTTIGALRMKYGAAQPFDIVPAVWISSICSVLVGVILVKVFNKYAR